MFVNPSPVAPHVVDGQDVVSARIDASQQRSPSKPSSSMKYARKPHVPWHAYSENRPELNLLVDYAPQP